MLMSLAFYGRSGRAASWLGRKVKQKIVFRQRFLVFVLYKESKGPDACVQQNVLLYLATQR